MGLALLAHIPTFLSNYLTLPKLMSRITIPKTHITTISTLILMVSAIFLILRILTGTVNTALGH